MAVAPQVAEEEALPARLGQLARALQSRFLGKDEVIRLLLVATLAGEHAVLIGPPGTAKSALIRTFARLMHARYFEYLLTRFTEPNEIFGPVDIGAVPRGPLRAPHRGDAAARPRWSSSTRCSSRTPPS